MVAVDMLLFSVCRVHGPKKLDHCCGTIKFLLLLPYI